MAGWPAPLACGEADSWWELALGESQPEATERVRRGQGTIVPPGHTPSHPAPPNRPHLSWAGSAMGWDGALNSWPLGTLEI